MARKSEYDKGWYDCYKALRTLFSGSMKDMLQYRSPSNGINVLPSKTAQTRVPRGVKKNARKKKDEGQGSSLSA